MAVTRTPIKLSEDLSALQIGAEMARLRAQYGLSQHQISERLHIRARYVAAIEDGKLELLPGKVYARGYLHTYAEFLGLDANQVLQLCFAGEGAVSSVTVHRPPPSLRNSKTAVFVGYRGVLTAMLLVLALVLGYSQLSGQAATEQQVETVAPALEPEAMLDSMRSHVMPRGENYECLATNQFFACARADAATRLLEAVDQKYFVVAGNIDVSSLQPPPVEEPDTSAGEAAPAAGASAAHD